MTVEKMPFYDNPLGKIIYSKKINYMKRTIDVKHKITNEYTTITFSLNGTSSSQFGKVEIYNIMVQVGNDKHPEYFVDYDEYIKKITKNHK